MTPGKIFWEVSCCEMGFDPREWSDLTHHDQTRIESGAQAVISAHASDQDDLMALLADLVRAILIDPSTTSEHGAMAWIGRAHVALSRVHNAPSNQIPPVDTQKPDDSPTGCPGASGRQVGGDHYHKTPIQPWGIIEAYGLDFWEGNALECLLRQKSGTRRVEDLKKAVHYLERCIERAEALEARIAEIARHGFRS